MTTSEIGSLNCLGIRANAIPRDPLEIVQRPPVWETLPFNR